jgi:hypothetical protein
MVSDFPPARRRWPAWIAAALLALITLGTAGLYELGCAAGEYEEHNHTCDASSYPMTGFFLLVAGLVVGRLTHREWVRWFGFGCAFGLALAGWMYA